MERVESGVEINGKAGVGRGAKTYAIKELARRAGVSAEFFRSWRVEFEKDETHIYVSPGSQKRIQFKHTAAPFWTELAEGTFRTARASWMQEPPNSVSALVPDFVVPFCNDVRTDGPPLFAAIDRDCVECPFDLPASALLTLSRWEETRDADRDEHGRFTSRMSVACRDGFLHRPIVDEYGLGLEQALNYLLPQWRPKERKLRVKLSHDIDEVGLSFNIKRALGHTVRRRRLSATVRDLFGIVLGLNSAYLEAVRDAVQASLDRGLHCAAYWQASPRSAFDSGYDIRHPKVKKMMSWLREHEVEQGVHPGYETFRSPDRLRAEVEVLQEVLGERALGGRQHYLRWCPDSWLHWESCGLAYDSSVGYADQVGFRAGTCIPYRPWLLSINREADLVEIPLIVMEATLLQKMGLTRKRIMDAILDCVSRCRVVGGVFTLLWHNTSLVDPVLADLYEKVLNLLAEDEVLRWNSSRPELY